MIQDKIDKVLLEDEAKKVNRIRSGKWSPSSFGRCYRYQYWNRLNEPKTNPIDALTLRKFKMGNLIHQFIQGLLKDEYASELKIETSDTLGYCDLINDNEVCDIKSVRSYQFKLMKDKKKPYDFKTDKKDNILQVVFYAKNIGRKTGRLVFVDKDSLDIIEYKFEVVDFEKELQEELTVLNQYWDSKTLPPASPRCYNGKECQYCSYEDGCIKERNNYGAE